MIYEELCQEYKAGKTNLRTGRIISPEDCGYAFEVWQSMTEDERERCTPEKMDEYIKDTHLAVSESQSADVLIYENVEYRVGDRIIGTDASEYEGLIGTITEIRDGEDKDTENETPDIYCDFEVPDSPEAIKRLEEVFSNLYDEPKTVDDICLDLVIMAPEMIRHLDESEENTNG